MEQQPNPKTFGDFLVFLILYLVTFFSSVTIHFMIIWWITFETGSAFYLSLTIYIIALPIMMFLPLIGVFIDTLNRKKVLIATSAIRILTLSILIFLIPTGISKLLLLLSILVIDGIIQAFYQSLFFAILPSMVNLKNLGRINALIYFLTFLTQMTAPVLASIMLSFFDFSQNILWISGIANGVMIITLLLIKIPQVKETRYVPKDNRIGFKLKRSITNYFKDFMKGFDIMIVIPGILVLFGVIFIFEFISFPFNALLSYYINFFHNGTALEYATISYVPLIGVTVGTIIYLIKKYWKPVFFFFFLSGLLIFLGNLVVILAPYRSFGLIQFAFFIKGLIIVLFNTIFQAFIQTNVPKNKIGRVNAIFFAIISFIPLFADFMLRFLLFYISDIKFLLLLTTLIGIISLIIIYFFSDIRKIKIEDYMIISGIKSSSRIRKSEFDNI